MTRQINRKFTVDARYTGTLGRKQLGSFNINNNHVYTNPELFQALNASIAYDFRLVAASVAIAIVASMAALWFAFYKRGLFTTLAGGVVQGLAIASMHYTAMAATYFVPLDATVRLSAPLFKQSSLAYMIASAMTIIAIGNLLLLAAISPRQNTYN